MTTVSHNVFGIGLPSPTLFSTGQNGCQFAFITLQSSKRKKRYILGSLDLLTFYSWCGCTDFHQAEDQQNQNSGSGIHLSL